MRAPIELFVILGLLVATPSAAAQEKPTGTPVDPDLFTREWTAAWNSRDVDRILTFYADGAIYEDVASVTNGWTVPWRGRPRIREALTELYEAMPDFSLELVSASGVEPRMAIEWIMTGTHLGDYPGLPATGRSISIRGISLIKLQGAKIATQRDYYDIYLFLRQLGAVPEPGAE